MGNIYNHLEKKNRHIIQMPYQKIGTSNIMPTLNYYIVLYKYIRLNNNNITMFSFGMYFDLHKNIYIYAGRPRTLHYNTRVKI